MVLPVVKDVHHWVYTVTYWLFNLKLIMIRASCESRSNFWNNLYPIKCLWPEKVELKSAILLKIIRSPTLHNLNINVVGVY